MTIQVTGAGHEEANAEYIHVRTLNGKPRFRAENGNEIWWFSNGMWQLGTDSQIFYSCESSAEKPPKEGWKSMGDWAPEPAPQLAHGVIEMEDERPAPAGASGRQINVHDIQEVEMVLCTMCQLWHSIQSKLESRAHADIREAMIGYFRDGWLQELLGKFDSAVARVAILSMAHHLPVDAMRRLNDMAIPFLCDLSEEKCVVSEYGPLIDCMCSWGRSGEVMKLIYTGMEKGVEYVKQNKTYKKPRGDVEKELTPKQSLIYLSYILKSEKCRPTLFAEENDGARGYIEGALQQTQALCEQAIERNASEQALEGTEESVVKFLVRALELYANFELHKFQAEDLKEKGEVMTYETMRVPAFAKDLLDWTVSKIVPVLRKLTESAEATPAPECGEDAMQLEEGPKRKKRKTEGPSFAEAFNQTQPSGGPEDEKQAEVDASPQPPKRKKRKVFRRRKRRRGSLVEVKRDTLVHRLCVFASELSAEIVTLGFYEEFYPTPQMTSMLAAARATALDDDVRKEIFHAAFKLLYQLTIIQTDTRDARQFLDTLIKNTPPELLQDRLPRVTLYHLLSQAKRKQGSHVEEIVASMLRSVLVQNENVEIPADLISEVSQAPDYMQVICNFIAKSPIAVSKLPKAFDLVARTRPNDEMDEDEARLWGAEGTTKKVHWALTQCVSLLDLIFPNQLTSQKQKKHLDACFDTLRRCIERLQDIIAEQREQRKQADDQPDMERLRRLSIGRINPEMAESVAEVLEDDDDDPMITKTLRALDRLKTDIEVRQEDEDAQEAPAGDSQDEAEEPAGAQMEVEEPAMAIRVDGPETQQLVS